MESPDWPQPSHDSTEYLFLYPFYHRGVRRLAYDSPQHSWEANRRRADQVAAKAIEKVTRLSQVYQDEDFPVIDLTDPCGLLPALPTRMSYRRGHSGSHDKISLRPVLERENQPASMGWLGKLSIVNYTGHDAHLHSVHLNQPSERGSIKLDRHPDHQQDSYPANAQAMNFIGLVDEYLDKLDQRRLIVVRQERAARINPIDALKHE